MHASQLVDTPLGPVEYACDGAGEPLLSFHGSPGGFDGAMLAAELHCGTGFRIIGFSRPGYLRTPLTSGSTVPEQADLAAALLDALNIPSALVYGLSGGGPYALAFAAQHPSRCRKLLLGAAVTAPDPRPSLQLELEARLLFLLDPIAWLANQAAPRSQWTRILNIVTPFAPRQAGYRNDIAVFGNFTPIALDRILCPTLIVHGTNDINASFPNAQRTAAALAHCQTLFVRGAGHMSLWSEPAVRRTIATFLSNG